MLLLNKNELFWRERGEAVRLVDGFDEGYMCIFIILSRSIIYISPNVSFHLFLFRVNAIIGFLRQKLLIFILTYCLLLLFLVILICIDDIHFIHFYYYFIFLINWKIKFYLTLNQAINSSITPS